MEKELELKWEKDVDELFRHDPEKGKHLIETNWTDYLNYFLDYFSPRIKHGAENGTLLDVGCGAGLISKELIKYGFKIYGVDFSAEAIEFAKKKIKEIDFRHSSIYALPFPDATFDAVICLGVLQTVTDCRKAVDEMKRVLKKDGVLVIRTLNTLSLSSFKAKKDNPFFFFYNPFSLKRQLEKEGFRAVSLKGIYFFPKRLKFLTGFVLNAKLHRLFNIFFFPVFVFFSHSFYMEAVKK